MGICKRESIHIGQKTYFELPSPISRCHRIRKILNGDFDFLKSDSLSTPQRNKYQIDIHYFLIYVSSYYIASLITCIIFFISWHRLD